MSTDPVASLFALSENSPLTFGNDEYRISFVGLTEARVTRETTVIVTRQLSLTLSDPKILPTAGATAKGKSFWGTEDLDECVFHEPSYSDQLGQTRHDVSSGTYNRHTTSSYQNIEAIEAKGLNEAPKSSIHLLFPVELPTAALTVKVSVPPLSFADVSTKEESRPELAANPTSHIRPSTQPVTNRPAGTINWNLPNPESGRYYRLIINLNTEHTDGPRKEGVQPLGPSPTSPVPPVRLDPLLEKPSRTDLEKLIADGENQNLEFKETLAIDTRTGKPSDVMVQMVVKTIAGFLNSDGGQLLIGVSDNGEIVGLTRDYSECGKRRDRDGFANKLNNILAARLSPCPVEKIQISFRLHESKEVCVVSASRCSQVVHVDGEVFVRFSNATHPLKGPELTSWLERRSRSN